MAELSARTLHMRRYFDNRCCEGKCHICQEFNAMFTLLIIYSLFVQCITQFTRTTQDADAVRTICQQNDATIPKGIRLLINRCSNNYANLKL